MVAPDIFEIRGSRLLVGTIIWEPCITTRNIMCLATKYQDFLPWTEDRQQTVIAILIPAARWAVKEETTSGLMSLSAAI